MNFFKKYNLIMTEHLISLGASLTVVLTILYVSKPIPSDDLCSRVRVCCDGGCRTAPGGRHQNVKYCIDRFFSFLVDLITTPINPRNLKKVFKT